MNRLFVIAFTASVVALWAVSSNAYDGRMPGVQNLYAAPGHVWPQTNHAPAITKTLQNAPFYAAPQVQQPAPAPYEQDWQRQPAPPAPVLAPPRFSYPQQGYYPREGVIQQAPGYEYDFGGGVGTFPPVYPMEGAAWREPSRTYRATGFSVAPPQYPPASNGHSLGTYADCPR